MLRAIRRVVNKIIPQRLDFCALMIMCAAYIIIKGENYGRNGKKNSTHRFR